MTDSYDYPPDDAARYDEDAADDTYDDWNTSVADPYAEDEAEAYETAPGEQRDDDDRAEENIAVNDNERLRQPRASAFRQRLRTQLSTLPLALALVALGLFLLARQQNVRDLPDLSTSVQVGAFVLVVAFTAVFHAVIFGRRQRGLIFLGLWVWFTAGAIALLVTSIDAEPDAGEWWPMLMVSMSVTSLVTYIIERSHDTRLVLLSIVLLVASAAAFGITTGTLDQQVLDNTTDYWPLLLTLLGIALLPLAFRRRTG